MSERDRQFLGFACLLVPEIDQIFGDVEEWAIARDASKEQIARELAMRWGIRVAQRAYDLACHIVVQVHEADGSAMDCGLRTPEQVVRGMVDMTAWPEG